MSSSGKASSGGLTLALPAVVLSAPSATISFSSIPQTFTHLLLKVLSRSTNAAAEDFMFLQFNGDNGANYDDGIMTAKASTQSNGTAQGQIAVFAGYVPGATAAASVPGVNELFIPGYALTTFQKVFDVVGGWADLTAANAREATSQGRWRNTAAITSIVLGMNSTTNFATGSAAWLYGI